MTMISNLLLIILCVYCSVAVAAEEQQNQRSLIIGGHDAEEGRYPYFATFDHFGGGVLIAPDIILTAGHCNPPLDQHVKVRINHDRFQSTNFANEPVDDETFYIEKIVRHPNYYEVSWDEKVNDFNIFKINGFSKQKPVKLNREFKVPKVGATVTVIGMGSMKADPATFVETSATTLQEVDLTILSQKQCELSSDPKRPFQAYLGRVKEESMICTSGGPNNEKDACAFDSGSPLLLTPSNSHVEEDTVVGLVSWGENCADPFFPAVNARVSFAMDFVDRTVCQLSEADPSLLTDFHCDSLPTYPPKSTSLEETSLLLSMDEADGHSSRLLALVLKACFLFGLVGVVAKKLADRKRRDFVEIVQEAEDVPLHNADA